MPDKVIIFGYINNNNFQLDRNGASREKQNFPHWL